MSVAFERGWTVPGVNDSPQCMGYLPLYFTDEYIRAKHRRYGNARFYRIIDPLDGIIGTTYLFDSGSEYDEAMKSLRNDVDTGNKTVAQHHAAVEALMKGVFEWTPDSVYLPRIGDEQL